MPNFPFSSKLWWVPGVVIAMITATGFAYNYITNRPKQTSDDNIPPRSQHQEIKTETSSEKDNYVVNHSKQTSDDNTPLDLGSQHSENKTETYLSDLSDPLDSEDYDPHPKPRNNDLVTSPVQNKDTLKTDQLLDGP